MEKSSPDLVMRDYIFELYELSVELGMVVRSAKADPEFVSVPRAKISRFLSIVPLVAGYAMALKKLPPKPKPSRRKNRLQKETVNADPILCSEALALILSHVDYTSRRCTLTEQIGAVLPAPVIHQARAALDAYRLRE